MTSPPSLALDAAAQFLSARLPQPQLGLVLGSGLGKVADQIEVIERVPYSDIPHMPTPSVHGHGGELIVGRLAGTLVACLSGRVHLYEGHSPQRVVFGARLLARWGVSAVLLTNAAGGIAQGCTPGSVMLITDHLNLTGQNPLLGPNDESLGPRFPDMSVAYDPAFGALLEELARDLGLDWSRGVYAGLLGPNYETPAEIRMLEVLGAGAVGMSTVLEVLALRHMGVRVAALSCITNLAAGRSKELLSHAEVAEVAARVQDQFGRLIVEFSGRVGSLLAD